ncbi:UDP-N-acetylmuramoyl-L-alanyl-D-glutamate--2,6-diaminopimelate ligase [Apilactobacillus ozensis]|uniref:UDP-N-acetylmuramoyl-L-alanyl-D-glutamate--2, 6-diaminopimelate ligase n=1 Tax=Apilactobacillus ozensis TaxID=866801 RepID=UPI00200B8418|nr:UDP-N-acetylmuramoyl-L-alanyl-D-glutamate--2,6-diaminopimelate ligase [Apilactobacillus ozensis]MCK8606656.1 UDP-N-acetylmuramoyl-L-alanyl-D-glutamate--2,6-diaminopimelate ligase [Apilactobacillus ozensis]
MSLRLTEILTILKEHNLLTNVESLADDLAFENLTYDSRQVTPKTLFCCKGNFKEEYLLSAKKAGATAYVSEKTYEAGQGMLSIQVSDIQKSMSLIGAAFYGYPQNDLFIIAYTGTKGKTTSSYFVRSILKNTTNNKIALFSTIDTVLGNKPEDRFKSHLTTPESIDIFKNMRRAVDNGMTHLVMEVSSQAYKKNRVFGLKFDVGLFLNISPDHIGPNEHPTFADYLHCKEQLLVNSRTCIINAETDYLDDVYYTAKATSQPNNVYLYSRNGFTNSMNLPVDCQFSSISDDLNSNIIKVLSVSDKCKKLNIDSDYELAVVGDYNESNAASAIIAAAIAGSKVQDAKLGLSSVLIPGRMESYESKNHGTVYVDYAHNYASMHALLGFLKSKSPKGRVIVVVGSPGNKGVDRREGFGKALTENADEAFLTTDDPAFENPLDIAKEIDAHIYHQKVDVHFVMDRKEAIKKAILSGDKNSIIVVAGKGRDPYQKINGVDTPYETDSVVVNNILKGL